MKSKRKSLLSLCPFKKLAPGGHDLFRCKIDRSIPFWLLKMNWVEHCIGDAQQLFTSRRDGQCHMAGCMSGCSDGIDTRHDFCFMIYEVELTLDRWKIPACEFKEDFFNMFVKFQFCLSRRPEIPFIFPHNVAGVGKSWLSFANSVTSYVVRMSMRKNDSVNVLRCNPLGLQVLKKFSCV